MGIMGSFLKRRGKAKYKANIAKGDLAEERVITACMRETRPWWLLEAKRTPRFSALDRAGVDVLVVMADLGTMRLQIKSSEHAAESFKARAKPGAKPIGVVVIRPEDDDNTIYGKVLGTLILMRETEEERQYNAKQRRKDKTNQ